MRFTKPQHFYHVTNKSWHEKVLLKPLRYDDISCSNRDDGEPDVAKICVSKTVAGCLVALHIDPEEKFIYRTLKPTKAVYTWRVCDVSVTEERWIVKPTWFIRVGKISEDEMEKLYLASCRFKRFWPGDPDELETQMKVRRVIEKFLIRTCPFLPETLLPFYGA